MTSDEAINGLSRPLLLSVVGVLLVAVAARAFLLPVHPLDFDQGASAVIASGSPIEVLSRSKTIDMHPPLFHLLLSPLAVGSSPDWVLRLLPWAAGVGMVLLSGITAARQKGFVALLYIYVLLGFNVFAIAESANLRMGTLASCFVLGALWFASGRWNSLPPSLPPSLEVPHGSSHFVRRWACIPSI